jgi:hypothetical protein
MTSVGHDTLPLAEQRGLLTIRPTAVKRIATRSLEQHTAVDGAHDVTITNFGDTSVALAATLTLPYPSEPVGALMDRLRAQVATDLEHALGRPIERLDLTVDAFRTAPADVRRRVF